MTSYRNLLRQELSLETKRLPSTRALRLKCRARYGGEDAAFRRPSRPAQRSFDDVVDDGYSGQSRGSGRRGGSDENSYSRNRGNSRKSSDGEGGVESEEYIGGGGRGSGSHQRRDTYSSDGQEGAVEGDVQYRPQYNNNNGERRPQSSSFNRRSAYFSISDEARELQRILSEEIRSAQSWRELAAFVENRGSQMDCEHAVQILYRLSFKPMGTRGSYGIMGENYRAYQRPADETERQQYDLMLSMLMGWLSTLLPSAKTRHVASALGSLARLDLFNAELLTELMTCATRQMVNFEPSDCSATICALSKFNFPLTPEFSHEFLERTPSKLRYLRPAELTRTAVALNTLGCVPTPAWAEAFWKASANQLSAMTEYSQGDLLMVSSVFAQSGLQPPQEWVDHVYGYFVGIGNSSHSPIKKEEMPIRDDGSSAGPASKPQMASSSFEKTVLKVNTITKLLYTLTSLSNKPSVQVMGNLLEALRKKLRHCSSQDLGTICLYLGRYLQMRLPQDICNSILKETLIKSDSMRGDDVAAISYLLATSQFKGRDRDVDDLVYSIKLKLNECSLSGLEMVYNALPSIGSSGHRLNETVTEAANKYNELLAQQQPGQEQPAASQEVSGAVALS
ncbi:hypothetical protein CEUSTIGMA_g8308.t1 [Chlamydomonas eustigma]|uniref:FAST kinase leucine-rich domain-containing protein n=1 Tax=Chlamydomonas eustigma TaxID=1157962 RepID=A0A250XCQ7_9CHLO|nr:hypothetical protein CEUSTIGMA_g8308.t1 [Chlamydomonas eustigma]|eukprot:GAX80873.1 hypothetical protein CEUSTIGMA_g8308.t1 [Chlamydomonas eustigma]